MSAPAPVRAGIVVTGTEVLTGRVPDRNGPWLAEQLRGWGPLSAQLPTVAEHMAHLLAGSDVRYDVGGPCRPRRRYRRH